MGAQNDQLDYNCVIVDIDGTIANCDRRRPHIVCKPKNWKAFNAEMHADTVHSDIDRLVRAFNAQGYRIVLCSGREEVYRAVTERWLDKWMIPFHALYMRAEKDYRADDIIKSELLDRILADGHKPWLVVDDRKRVVDMWRKRGLTCLQCAEGDF